MLHSWSLFWEPDSSLSSADSNGKGCAKKHKSRIHRSVGVRSPDLPWATWDLRHWEWWLELQLHEYRHSNRYNQDRFQDGTHSLCLSPTLAHRLDLGLSSLCARGVRTSLSKSARLKFSTLRFFQLETYNQTFMTSNLKQIASLI